ncbi:hypothetical protein MCOR27_010443 [Pyricularia oryzae]|uniref:Cleavage and polyadenylation specificity factor subunit 2 n=1 Tax=Pyricularia grisea TaxID=148305 RepID=A0ABQ8NVM0_PYRGI|nr:hypothetical protein MCOR01_004414 [Pyricularia oryzae]KAI6302682.1 hypothetical protein MCOR33_001952 [Pyricularia grisea]KAI6256796.1 hypothetical protein MCOR19_006740 [Pyricularia oryzae]KAI6265463.1 hypothetical protein MCOR26_010730 [Pyricularia oryzae]KAI6267801.1 hypothetical protein MCOR27_010443 [Pyricularia oryzae]
MFTFSPLQGALSEATASQSLLELDGGVKVLIDIGWDETFDVEKLKEVEKQVPTLSLILLTHATVPHLSALVHCCKNFPLFARIPIYATQPVIDLGRTLIQDLYSSTPAAATSIPDSALAEASYSFSQTQTNGHGFLLQAPSPDEIAKYFSLIQPLKYSQPHQPLASPFSPPLNGLTITAYNAGHSLGGTIWHIQHGMESIVYAVDWNLARDNVYAGAAWMGGGHGGGGAEVIEQLRKPTALVCSTRTAEGGLTRAARDKQLLDTMRMAISRGGTVLIPVDSSARVLELAYLLEHAWRSEASTEGGGLSTAKLYLAGRSVHSTIKLAKSMFEWMDNSIVQEFEAGADQGFRRTNGAGGNADAKGKDGGPFDFKYLRLLDRKAQVLKLLEPSTDELRGKVILATDTSLEWGFSKDIISAIANDSRNMVILPEKPAESSRDNPSISRQLWRWWKERRDGVADEQSSGAGSAEQVFAGGRELQIRDSKKVPLADSELSIYQQWLATQRQLNATVQGGGASALEASADVADDVSSESSSDSDDSENEQQGKALNASTTQASRKKVVLQDEDLGVMILLKKPGVYDFPVKGKKGRERMFPLAVRRKRNDEFGELIRPEDYLRAEEREENERPDTQQLQSDGQDGFGQKRKWDDAGSRNAANGLNRRGQRGQADDADAAQAASGPAPDELDLVEDVEEEVVTGPAKLVHTSTTVSVNLRLALIDFSGLHDRRSLAMLIPLIQPRKLILVAGSADETEAVADDCRRNAIEVFTPPVGAVVDASVDTNAWVVKLADPLVKRLKWQQVRGLGIVTVTAQLTATPAAQKNGIPLLIADDDGANKRQKIKATGVDDQEPTAEDEDVGVMPTLDVLPVAMVSASRSAAQVLHVGELRLADLRRTMQNLGHSADFRGEGTLLIDGTVVVRKTAAGRVEIESVGVPGTGGGPAARMGGTFYAVKKTIYDGLAVVAGA